MNASTWSDRTFIHDAAALVKAAVTAGASFSSALRNLKAQKGVEGVSPVFYKDVFAQAFAVSQGETSIFGGWDPDGPSSIDDARLDRELFDVIVDASKDQALVHRTIRAAYKGYAYQAGASEYFIARELADSKEVVRVERLELNGRTLTVTVSAPLSTGERALRRIALVVILYDLLNGKYDRAVDKLVWLDSERPAKYEEAYVPSTDAH